MLGRIPSEAIWLCFQAVLKLQIIFLFWWSICWNYVFFLDSALTGCMFLETCPCLLGFSILLAYNCSKYFLMVFHISVVFVVYFSPVLFLILFIWVLTVWTWTEVCWFGSWFYWFFPYFFKPLFYLFLISDLYYFLPYADFRFYSFFFF